jgi:hypothetical protein
MACSSARTHVRIVRRRIILEEFRHALGIQSDEVANYCFPKAWPHDREQRARIIGEWLQAEARFLA